MNRLVHQLRSKVVQRLRPKPVAFATHTIQFNSTAGYRIYAKVLIPEGLEPIPAVVLCPGDGQDHQVFFNEVAPIQAIELAQMGIAVLCYDPSGRGQSWGPEDCGGIEHQDNVVQAVQWLRQTAMFELRQVGLLSISLGVASAIGAAKALAQSGQPVSWVIDWNGPCDHASITKNDTQPGPAMGHKSDDLAYWEPREAVRAVGQIDAGYWRLEAQPDLATTNDSTRVVQAMLDAAQGGNLPWFRLNDHPVGRIPSRIVWIRSGANPANHALRKAVKNAFNPD